MAEIEQIPIWMTARGYATGRGDTVEDMLAELEAQVIQRLIDNAPEPLKTLGERLADLLDADHWNNIEPQLLDLAARMAAPMKLFEDHYWDSLHKDRDIILLHVKAVLGMQTAEPHDLDTCECGDYRKDHAGGAGGCIFTPNPDEAHLGDGHSGAGPCHSFRLAWRHGDKIATDQ